jgi:hypothetical protein
MMHFATARGELQRRALDVQALLAGTATAAEVASLECMLLAHIVLQRPYHDHSFPNPETRVASAVTGADITVWSEGMPP